MRTLTPQQVLFLHARMIEEIGGSHGVRDLGLLLSALARPSATFEGRELYPSLFSKAAAILESLVNNHPFVDGNERTGIGAAALFLSGNGYKLAASKDQIVSFTLGIAQGGYLIEEIADWLEAHAEPQND
ncbi:MAG: type II toxin-antitoxin system death-on-curing family toxin [Anaerolineales bacterium]|nr:type II toxin-antitoxin system death-on-curing family toxin [Anaerolineales bacterium]